eukprot:10109-Heterococcus_DN1.PRE.1
MYTERAVHSLDCWPDTHQATRAQLRLLVCNVRTVYILHSVWVVPSLAVLSALVFVQTYGRFVAICAINFAYPASVCSVGPSLGVTPYQSDSGCVHLCLCLHHAFLINTMWHLTTSLHPSPCIFTLASAAPA